ncbi:MAG: tripartite tricarboxylate transporter TctB family protein [Thermodesulfobacteriota bacterium]|nr:tripartite tricarboxylate transporter TctB family protein [Thermodesulfobacteriota bacterium]
MRKGDRVFGLICLGLSFWLILESRKFDYTTRYTAGPGFLPFWLGVCLGLLSLYLLFNTFARKGDKEDDKAVFPKKKSLLRVGLILLFIAAFAFFMNTLGFTLTVFLSVTLILFTLERYKIFKSIFYGIMFSGSVFLIFRYWLNVDLPKGWLGF